MLLIINAVPVWLLMGRVARDSDRIKQTNTLPLALIGDAAKLIQGVIKANDHQTRDGHDLARKAATTMTQIVQTVLETCVAIKKVDSASVEQAQGVRQTSGIVSHLYLVARHTRTWLRKATPLQKICGTRAKNSFKPWVCSVHDRSDASTQPHKCKYFPLTHISKRVPI